MNYLLSALLTLRKTSIPCQSRQQVDVDMYMEEEEEKEEEETTMKQIQLKGVLVDLVKKNSSYHMINMPEIYLLTIIVTEPQEEEGCLVLEGVRYGHSEEMPPYWLRGEVG